VPRKIPITPQDLKAIERLSGLGLTTVEIADVLDAYKKYGFSERTLYRWKKRPEVVAAFKKGKAKMKATTGTAIARGIAAGNSTLIIWFEKSRGLFQDPSALRMAAQHSDRQIQQFMEITRQEMGPETFSRVMGAYHSFLVASGMAAQLEKDPAIEADETLADE
jgi:hypothetical protein